MSRSYAATSYLASFILGLGLGTYYSVGPSYSLLFAAVIFRPFRFLILCLFSLWLGMSYTHWWRNTHTTNFSGKSSSFDAVIVDPPDVRSDTIMITVLPINLTRSERQGSANGRILIRTDRYPEWHYGDMIHVQGKIEAPEAFNGFNYPLYLERYQIYGVIQKPLSVKVVQPGQGNRLLKILYNFRSTLESAIQKALPEPEASLLNGILLGSKQSLPVSLKDDLQITGTSHIVAISGANITIILTLLLTVLPIYNHRRQFYWIVGISLFIVLLTGASASVVRGAVVACAGRYLRLMQRKPRPTPFMAITMALLLAGNPLLLTADPGFQLSFAAFAGLVYLHKPISSLLDRSLLTRAIPELFRTALAETLAATLATAPLSLLLFGQLSFLGLIVNPLILWLLTPISFLGFAILLVSPFHPIVAMIRIPLWLCLHAVLSIIRYFAQFRGGLFQV